MKFLLSAAALLLAPAAAHAQTAPAAPAAATDAPMIVYDKALGQGWENWSFGKTELSLEDAGARKPMRLEAGPWQAAYLHHAAFSTTPYRSLNLLLQTSGAEADVRIVAIVGGKPIQVDPAATGPNVEPKGKTVRVKPGGWMAVQVPLADLGAVDTNIDGIWVQNASPNAAPPIYIAEVQFKP